MTKKIFAKNEKKLSKAFLFALFVLSLKQIRNKTKYFSLLNLIIMSAIIKNQYNAVKEIVNQIEVLYKEYDNNPSDKNFNHFCKMFDYFLLITGNVTVGYYSVISNAMTPSGKSHLDWCKELFQQYESDLKKSGLLKPSFEDILSDVEDITPVETIEYTEEQKLSMWYENQKQYEYDTQF